jgi:hypothetical protein
MMGCPDASGCGNCPTAFAWSDYFEITSDVALAGGTWTDGSRTYTFDVDTCNLSFVLNDTLCSPLPGSFTLSPDGTGSGETIFGCWSSVCECTTSRPSGSCSATRL